MTHKDAERIWVLAGIQLKPYPECIRYVAGTEWVNEMFVCPKSQISEFSLPNCLLCYFDKRCI